MGSLSSYLRGNVFAHLRPAPVTFTGELIANRTRQLSGLMTVTFLKVLPLAITIRIEAVVLADVWADRSGDASPC